MVTIKNNLFSDRQCFFVKIFLTFVKKKYSALMTAVEILLSQPEFWLG